MDLLSWIVFGLVAGAIAKLIMPGRGPGGIIVTILLGIVGSVVGGFIGQQLHIGGGGFFQHLSLAVIGGLVVLFIYGLVMRRGAA